MTTPLIRRAADSDAKELVRLSSQLGYPADETAMRVRLARILSSRADRLLVAGDLKGGLAGWIHGYLCQLIESEYRVEIGGLIVDERWRRRGVGTRLAREIEAWAAEQGAVEVSVRCQIKRTEAHQFYERLAFHPVKTQIAFRKRLTDVS